MRLALSSSLLFGSRIAVYPKDVLHSQAMPIVVPAGLPSPAVLFWIRRGSFFIASSFIHDQGYGAAFIIPPFIIRGFIHSHRCRLIAPSIV
ncbi:hypothetical protein C8J56DRAFT_945199 [Mycena floridula]|nr:hypothetical protein C8J56DRAFT_944927 [Mycena floridula]KAJ7586652.1 hypothetical protein C8J56DRAFT_945199 [Mycena floridula]